MNLKAATVAMAAGMALAVGIGACGDGGPVGPDSPENTGTAGAETGSVGASVIVGPFEDGQQSVVVRIEGKELAVGAYQGRLRFDASSITLARVVKGEGGQGSTDSREFHVVNDRRAEEGELRFGAYAVEGFADPVALELAFDTPRAIQASDLELTLEVVGTVKGRPVPRGRTSVREVLR